MSQLRLMSKAAGQSESSAQRRDLILSAAITVFGKYGFRKVSVEDLAEAARISKQGLYLYFQSKQELFLAAIQRYLDEGLVLVQAELDKPETPLLERLTGAMDAWFGRHLTTFSKDSLDVIETENALAAEEVRQYKTVFKAKLAKAISESPEYCKQKNACTPNEISQVLLTCGLTWKEGDASRAEFTKAMRLCIRACCQINK